MFSCFSFHTPDDNKTKPVIVQIIIVSINGSSIATSPSDTGSFVFAEACAIGADPCPASFEYNPLFTPLDIANEIEAPRKPPTAALPENTSEKIEIKEGTIF